MLQLSPSTDQDKLRESLELSALRKANREEYEKRISQDPERVWLMKRILAIRQRGVREVIIPDEGKDVYDRFIKEHPYLIPRHQHYFPRIFSFIKHMRKQQSLKLRTPNRTRLTYGGLIEPRTT
jgi:hypothetical protein